MYLWNENTSYHLTKLVSPFHSIDDKFSYNKFAKISLRPNLTVELTMTLKELRHSLRMMKSSASIFQIRRLQSV